MANKKKVLTSVVALGTAAALTLGGTFAWQSISQTALNEGSDIVNPGGRLHDDFDGSDKNVYVENFADDDIFARIRLEEYFEIVLNAGTDAEKSFPIVGAKTDLGEGEAKYEYEVFKGYDSIEDGVIPAAVDDDGNSWWNWTMGGKTVFMPTFNKNKDSLKADINGEYLFDVGVLSSRDNDQYTEMATYEVDNEKDLYAIYDIDSNGVDEVALDDVDDIIESGEAGEYSDNIKTKYETHTAKETATANLISMDEWLVLVADGYDEDTHGNYWVYDTDGWVYWSAPIHAGEATGLLLDGIELGEVMDNSWYYALNVEAQFVTANDSGKDDSTGFYYEDAPSENAEKLMETIGVSFGEPEDESLPMLTMHSSNDYNSTGYIKATANEGFRLKTSSGKTHSGENMFVMTYGGDMVLEEGTDYTYKNGVMTLKVNSANKEGLNSYGSYIFVETDNCRGMILLEDDGALTLSYNAETEEHNIPDCTLAAVNSGVTVMDLKGETPENVTLNFESVSYSESDEHYTYEDGVLTITDENWVGKRVRVNGTNLGNAWIIVTSGDNSSAGGRDDDTAEAITVEMNTDDYSEWSTYAPKVVPGYKITLECEKEINDLSVKYLESIDWDEDDNERWTFIDLIKDTDYTYDEETHTLTFLSSDTVNGVVDGTIGEYHEIGVSTKVEDGEGNEISYRVLFKLVTPEIFSVARYETEWSKGTGNGTLNIEFIDGDVDEYYVNYLLTYTVDSGDDEIITLTPNVTLYDKSNNVVDAECDAFSSLQDYYIGATDGYIVEEVGDVHYLVKDGVSDDYENQYIVKSEADKLYIRTTKVNDTFKMLFNYTVEMNGTTVGEYADYQNMLVLNPAN